MKTTAHLLMAFLTALTPLPAEAQHATEPPRPVASEIPGQHEAYRNYARDYGYNDRALFVVETGFWRDLEYSSMDGTKGEIQALSELFAVRAADDLVRNPGVRY